MEKSVMVVLYLDSQVVCREKGKESLYFILLYFIVLYCIVFYCQKISILIFIVALRNIKLE